MWCVNRISQYGIKTEFYKAENVGQYDKMIKTKIAREGIASEGIRESASSRNDSGGPTLPKKCKHHILRMSECRLQDY